MGVLTVVLKKITNLKDSDTLGRSDPYVMFHLEQDNWLRDRNMGKHTSSTKKNDCNPTYDETFTFEDVNTLDNMKLYIKVKDQDIGIDDFLGQCEINLEKLDLDGTPMQIEKTIDSKKGKGWFSRKAKIFLDVTYAQ